MKLFGRWMNYCLTSQDLRFTVVGGGGMHDLRPLKKRVCQRVYPIPYTGRTAQWPRGILVCSGGSIKTGVARGSNGSNERLIPASDMLLKIHPATVKVKPWDADRPDTHSKSPAALATSVRLAACTASFHATRPLLPSAPRLTVPGPLLEWSVGSKH
ncbi:hypothetical protein BDW74DRAFT_5213 [Aspergillus multicolor]|uniref:uncharacterized protein n=1 Tax=Aspergillus multicolor TaxID=41759 RepID=UPI003CCDDB83